VPGFQELIVIAFVALLVFGPDRLPEIARTAGQTLARFRAETQRNVAELKQLAEVQELETELRGLRHELRGTKQDLARQLRASAEPDGTRRRTGRMVPANAPAAQAVRADDDPPPVDLEAT
jgi:sec-independent protein translocase protein TatB